MGIKERFKESLKERSPWLAALFNVIWGLGYLYAGRKKLVGISLLTMIAGVWGASIAFLTGKAPVWTFQLVLMGSIFFVSAALARDAYIEAKKRDEGPEHP